MSTPISLPLGSPTLMINSVPEPPLNLTQQSGWLWIEIRQDMIWKESARTGQASRIRPVLSSCSSESTMVANMTHGRQRRILIGRSFWNTFVARHGLVSFKNSVRPRGESSRALHFFLGYGRWLFQDCYNFCFGLIFRQNFVCRKNVRQVCLISLFSIYFLALFPLSLQSLQSHVCQLSVLSASLCFLCCT